MLKRLGMGLVKGLVLGLILGAGLQLGLGWTQAGGLLGFLLAMGTGATAGVVCGKPPWRAGSWIEATLKAVFGLGVGALLFWIGSTFLSAPLPFAFPGADAATPWVELPLLLLPVISSLYGAIVELDNTEPPTGEAQKKGPRARVKLSLDDDEPVEASFGSSDKRRHTL